MKRILSLLLALCVIASMPVVAFAEDTVEETLANYETDGNFLATASAYLGKIGICKISYFSDNEKYQFTVSTDKILLKVYGKINTVL